jgi:positive regulator of sigma E activity
MVEKAIVRELLAEGALVECASDCASCHGCGKKKPQRLIKAANRRALALSPGDVVDIQISSSRAVGAAFLVLILPLLMFIFFYFGAAWLFAETGEGSRVLAGFLGLTLGLLSNLLWRRPLNQGPDILRIVATNAPQTLHPHS